MKMVITRRGVEALPIPKGKRAVYTDAKTSGFCLMVQPSGKKSFCWYRKLCGLPTHRTLGEYPALSVETARQLADELNGKVARWRNDKYRGPSPLDRERAVSVGSLFDAYVEQHVKRHCKNPETAANHTRWIFGKYLSAWKNRTPESLRREHVRTRLAEIAEKHGQYSSNRVLQLLKALFNFASANELWDGENPCKGIKQYRETSRDRFLQPDELPRFFHALADDATPRDFRDTVLVSLFSGARAGNVFSMKWADLDLERGTWHISDTKNRTPYNVALAPELVTVLERRRSGAASEWVFESNRKRGEHVTECNYQWRKFLKRAGLANFRYHDLRRSLGSWAAGGGTSLLVIAKALGHVNTNATQIYSRLSLEPVRAAVSGAVSAMLASGGVERKALGAETGD